MTRARQIQQIGVFSSCLPGWNPQRIIDVAVSLGLTTIEWGSGPGHAIERPDRGPEIRRLCDRAGIRSGGVSVQDPEITLATPERVWPHLALAVELGVPHLRLLAPRYQGGDLDREQQRARAGLDELVDAAGPAGPAVLVETSPSTLAPAPDLAVALVEHHPPERAGLLYDPGNMAIEGHLEPALAVARLGAHLRHVHVKNIAWLRDRDMWHWRHASLATGIVDWRSILRALARAEYEGQFSIDHLGGEASEARLGSETALLRTLVSEAFGPPGQLNAAAPDKSKGTAKSPAGA